ncbi:uncharacterized protein LOC143574202 [Bidens hawaiensis]|uniref:uncharacterized protein LOC143574202 n=1 Tax=Bidens hawaiensis TaxID=980011 RepID=UPI00404A1DA2
MSNLIENEPAFRKSKHSFSGNGGGDQNTLPLPRVSRSKISFWSVFKLSKTKKCDLHDDESSNKSEYSSPASVKRRGWYIPSPMKVFRHSKTTKLQIHERSPMHRG